MKSKISLLGLFALVSALFVGCASAPSAKNAVSSHVPKGVYEAEFAGHYLTVNWPEHENFPDRYRFQALIGSSGEIRKMDFRGGSSEAGTGFWYSYAVEGETEIGQPFVSVSEWKALVHRIASRPVAIDNGSVHVLGKYKLTDTKDGYYCFNSIGTTNAQDLSVRMDCWAGTSPSGEVTLAKYIGEEPRYLQVWLFGQQYVTCLKQVRN